MNVDERRVRQIGLHICNVANKLHVQHVLVKEVLLELAVLAIGAGKIEKIQTCTHGYTHEHYFCSHYSDLEKALHD